MLLKKLNTKIKEYTLKDSTFLYPLEIEVCTFRPNVVADGELRSSVAPTRVRSGKVRAAQESSISPARIRNLEFRSKLVFVKIR